MAELHLSYLEHLSKWESSNLSEEVIISNLKQNGLEENQISELLTLYKKKKNDAKQRLGFILAAVGSFIGFLSCVFSMLDLSPNMRDFMLYGLTTIGIIIAFVGLFLVFE